MHVTSERFEELVAEAIDGLPEWVLARLENVVVLAAPWATPAQAQAARTGAGKTILGLYEGVPLTRRGRAYSMRPPDRITLFHLALEQMATSEQALKRTIQRTIVHEIGHHFGFDEEQIRGLGY